MLNCLEQLHKQKLLAFDFLVPQKLLKAVRGKLLQFYLFDSFARLATHSLAVYFLYLSLSSTLVE